MILLIAALAALTPARADVNPPAPKSIPIEAATLSSIRIEEPPAHPSSASEQLLTFAVGPVQPEAVSVSNGTYQFDYGSRPMSLQAQLGWALKLVDLAGGWYFESTLGFTSFSGSALPAAGLSVPGTSYSMGVVGIDGRLMYAGDWFPWKPLIPFVDGGYRYSVFYQPGQGGLDAAEGGVGNPVASLGLRFWLNRRASLNGSTPFFLSAKAERVFPAQNSLNLAATSFFGGLSIGL